MPTSPHFWNAKINAHATASPFMKKVWKAMLRIPRGKVSTYAAVARAIGKPGAARAVGNACNVNPFAPHVPCHRIVAANGGLGGYALGLKKKIQLLKREGVRIEKDKIVNFDRVAFDC